MVGVRTLLEGEGQERLPVDVGRHGRYAGYTLGYNESLLAQRLRDVLVAAGYLRDRLPAGAPLYLVGQGWAGPAALLAAARAPELFSGASLRWEWDFRELTDVDDPRVLPGVLGHGGIERLGGLAAPMPVAIVGASERVEELAPVWSAHAAGSALVSVEHETSALQWLLSHSQGARARR